MLLTVHKRLDWPNWPITKLGGKQDAISNRPCSVGITRYAHLDTTNLPTMETLGATLCTYMFVHAHLHTTPSLQVSITNFKEILCTWVGRPSPSSVP